MNPAYTLGLAAAAGLPLSLFVPLAMAPLAALAAVAALPAAWGRPGGLRSLPRTWFVSAGLFCAWAAISSLWAIDPLHSLQSTAQLAGVLVVGTVLLAAAESLDEAEQRVVRTFLLVGVGVGFAALALDMHTGSALTRFFRGGLRLPLPPLVEWQRVKTDRGATVLALALLPTLGALAAERRRWAATGLLLLGAFAILSSFSLSSKVGLTVGVLALLGAIRWPAPAARLLAAALLLGFALGPPLAGALPNPQRLWETLPITGSLHHRLTIWRFAAGNIVEKPAAGWGMDQSRALPGATTVVTFSRTDPRTHAIAEVHEGQMPLHPHNAILQIWLELGAVGVVLALGVLWALLRGAARDAAAVAIFAAAVVMSCVSYGIWQSWWLSTLALAAALAAAVRPSRVREAEPCPR